MATWKDVTHDTLPDDEGVKAMLPDDGQYNYPLQWRFPLPKGYDPEREPGWRIRCTYNDGTTTFYRGTRKKLLAMMGELIRQGYLHAPNAATTRYPMRCDLMRTFWAETPDPSIPDADACAGTTSPDAR